ncbi:hypothetical protein Q0M94_24160 (plasmid) [Deinococcus radiomollis]|uniref:hypothetical protein n=1 Tax=Deinococcus radiomollis TaxID=468916 RepID=UPI003892870B
MTSPAIRPYPAKARGEQQNVMQRSAPHTVPTSPLVAHVDALTMRMLMADRFASNIILE